MQSHAPYRWGHRCCPKTFLPCGQTPAEFERHLHRPPGIVFVSHRDAEHSYKALAHYRMELPPILAHYILSKGVECKQQAMQGIEINTRPLGCGGSHRTAKYCDRPALGLACRGRSRARRRWRRKRLATGRAEHCRQCHILAAVDTKLPQSGATRRTENRVLFISVLAYDTESSY
jgi:hypothetical protein